MAPTGGRPISAIWAEVTVVGEQNRNQLKDVTCNHCNILLHKVQPSRKLLHHVLKGCSSIPPEKRSHYERVSKASKRRRLIIAQQAEARDAQDARLADDEAAERVGGANSGAEAGIAEIQSVNGSRGAVNSAERPDFAEEANRDEVMQSSAGGVDEATLEQWDAIAMMFYMASWSFNSIELPTTRKVLKRIYPGIPLPNRHHLAGMLLIRAYKRILKAVIRSVSGKRYVAIAMDGWSNSRRQSLVNVILLYPGMSAIVWATKCTGDAVKTGPFIANFVLEVIDDIETQCDDVEVVSLSTDNARNMRSAWEILEAERSVFFCTGCSAHTLNLLVKDIAKYPFVSEIFRQANVLAVFVRSHTNTNERLSRDQAEHPGNSQRGLGVSIATRWYSQRDCVQNVLDNEDAIRRMMADITLLKSYDKGKVADVKAIVNSDTFWIQGGVVLQLLDPIIECIAHFEKDGCSLSVVFEQFVRLKNLAIYNQKTPGIPGIVQQQFRRKIRARWRFIHRSSMKLAYLLDHTKSTVSFSEEEIASLIQQLVGIVVKLNYLDSEVDQFQEELSRFMSNKLKWSSADRALFYRMHPFAWWSSVGIINYPLVSLVAQRVFTIPTSSASAERAWSIHGYICSDRRGSLSNEKAHMLAAIYTNNSDRSSGIEHEAIFRDQEDLWGNGCDPLRYPDMENDSDNDLVDESDDDSCQSFDDDSDQDADDDPPQNQQVLEPTHGRATNQVGAATAGGLIDISALSRAERGPTTGGRIGFAIETEGDTPTRVSLFGSSALGTGVTVEDRSVVNTGVTGNAVVDVSSSLCDATSFSFWC